jgi:hypothetical protein
VNAAVWFPTLAELGIQPLEEKPARIARRPADAPPGPAVTLFSRAIVEQLTVELGPAVLEQIEAADQRVNGDRPYGRREVGGFLLASRAEPNRIQLATDSSTANTSTSMELLPRGDVAAGRMIVAGEYHCHPPGTHLVPSEGDLKGFRGELVRSGADRWLALILMPAEFGGWEIAGYVATRWPRERHRVAVEPVQVVVRGNPT